MAKVATRMRMHLVISIQPLPVEQGMHYALQTTPHNYHNYYYSTKMFHYL